MDTGSQRDIVDRHRVEAVPVKEVVSYFGQARSNCGLCKAPRLSLFFSYHGTNPTPAVTGRRRAA
jgi:hypothetical protein